MNKKYLFMFRATFNWTFFVASEVQELLRSGSLAGLQCMQPGFTYIWIPILSTYLSNVYYILYDAYNVCNLFYKHHLYWYPHILPTSEIQMISCFLQFVNGWGSRFSALNFHLYGSMCLAASVFMSYTRGCKMCRHQFRPASIAGLKHIKCANGRSGSAFIYHSVSCRWNT